MVIPVYILSEGFGHQDPLSCNIICEYRIFYSDNFDPWITRSPSGLDMVHEDIADEYDPPTMMLRMYSCAINSVSTGLTAASLCWYQLYFYCCALMANLACMHTSVSAILRKQRTT